MKSRSLIGFGITFSVVCGLVLTMGTAAFRAKADVWNKKTVLTVYQPIQVQDTYLEPGTYVFKLADSSSNRHIVQIFNRDEDQVINTFLAIPNYRLQPTGDSRFTFYETPPGTARAMRAWFYPGDSFGQEFRYPKHPRVLLASLTPQLALPPEPPPPPIVTQPAEPAPVQQSAEEPPKREEPPLIAQATPPPPAPEAAPQPPAQSPPTELPQTATPYPLIGLGGLLALAAYGMLRMKS
ncbi:MAG: hypothetical protein ACRD96_25970 [Bryobacteraceae bacterium]